MKYHVEIDGREHEVEVRERLGELEVFVEGERVDLTYEEVDRMGQVALRMDGRSFGLSIEGGANDCNVTIAGHHYAVRVEDERERAAHAAEREAARHGGVVKSVMPGVVAELLVAPGDRVSGGQPMLILEAMKMQNEIAAPQDGVVGAVHVAAGQAVGAGANLVTLEAPEEA
jgi:biotin carboxyl carrier protein